MNNYEKPNFQQIVKRHKSKENSVPNWLVDVLEWIARTELANSSLSISSWTFKQLCWPKLHGNVKPFKIGILKYWPERNKFGNIRLKFGRYKINAVEITNADLELIPFANIPPPAYILGFEQIFVYHLDEQIMQFMKHILHLIDEVCLRFVMKREWIEEVNEEVTQIRLFLEMLNGKIFGIDMTFYSINEFDILFPGLVDQIQFISTDYYRIDTQLNWLTNWNNNGNQKMVEFDVYDSGRFKFIGPIINWFLIATQRVNIFMIVNDYYNEIVDINEQFKFTLENQQTDEILTVCLKPNPENQSKTYIFIARYPKGEDHWKEEGEKKYWPLIRKPHSNRLTLNVNESWENQMIREEQERRERNRKETIKIAITIILAFSPIIFLLIVIMIQGNDRKQ